MISVTERDDDMDSVVENFKAKNYDLEIEGSLYAVNRGLDFAGFLDADQALGAVMFTDILKDLDEKSCEEWTIHGWYPRDIFGEDHDGKKDDMSFFNEAYFTNEEMMDELWYRMPCLSITKTKGMKRVWIGIDDAPYLRHTIMEHIPMKRINITNDQSFPFPGEDALIEVRDDRYLTEDGYPMWMRFRMPEAYCITYYEGDDRKQAWRFITPDDHKDMFAKLNEMSHEYWEERRRDD